MSDVRPQTENLQASPVVRRRRWPRRLGFVLLALVALVAAAPYLMRIGPLRTLLLSAAFRDLNGTVHVGSAPLGWGSPIRLYDVQIRPESGPPLVQIPAIEGDRPLWRLIIDRQALGTISLEQPLTQIVVSDAGPNFERLFPPRPRDPEEIRRQREQLAKTQVTLAIRLVDGRVSWKGPESPQAWEVGPINIAIGLERPPSEPDAAPLLVVQPGKVLDHVELKPEMCRDIFKFVAPSMAGVSRAQGSFSLEFDEWRLPLDMPEQGKLGGRFTIHRIATSPSPLIEMITSAVHLTAPQADVGAAAADEVWLELANESVVSFEMHDGRVYHRDLRFGLGTLQIETSGSVGVADETLDIEARIHLPGSALTNRPFLHALSEQTLVLPIQGTLKQPRIDAKRLGQSSLQALLGAVDAAAKDGSRDDAQLEQDLDDSGLVGEGSLFGEGGLVDEQGNLSEEGLGEIIEQGVNATDQLLDWWKQRRAERGDKADQDGGQEGRGQEGGGLFDRLRRRRSAPAATPGESAPEGEPGPSEEPSEDAQAAPDEPEEAAPAEERRGRLFEGLRRRRRGDASDAPPAPKSAAPSPPEQR